MTALFKEQFGKLTLAAKLLIIHSAVILVVIGMYPTGIFTPDFPFDDIYLIYFFVPGIHIYWLGGQLVAMLKPFLLSIYSRHMASIVGVVLIPGVVGLILGGVQWYLIGIIITRLAHRYASRIKL